MDLKRVSTSIFAAAAAAVSVVSLEALAQNNQVVIDGSSTVTPIVIGLAEKYQAENPDQTVSVATSGSGGGFQKFCVGETDISMASRPIRQSEIDICNENGINFVELPIAFDGLAVVVGSDNTFAECLTVEELNTMWNFDAEGTVTSWSDVRGDFPSTPLALFGPGTDSGTFDYFVEAILDEDDIRADFTPSEDDNVIVTGVSGTPGGLGFFGLAFFEANSDVLNVVAVDGGNGCVAPTTETVADGTYAPLSRPLFIYVRATSIAKSSVASFVEYTLNDQGATAAEVGYIALPANVYETGARKIQSIETGSSFQDVEPGTPIDEIFN